MYMSLMISGSKGQKSEASLLAKGFLTPTSLNEVTDFSFGEYKNGGLSMVSKVGCAMVTAMGATLLEVEADVSGGLPDIEMTGNLGSSVKDGRERIRVAIKKCGYPFPQGRVTINIAPAAMRKEGTGFDLAVACAIPAFFLNHIQIFIRSTKEIPVLAVLAGYIMAYSL